MPPHRFGNLTRMRRNPTPFIAALAIGGALLVGCSSNDGAEVVGPPRTTPALSKSDYVIQANAICSEAESQIIGFQTDSGSESGSPDAGAARTELLGQITPVAQRAIDELKALTPPPEDAAMINEGIQRMQATLDTAQTNPTAIIDPIGISGPELNEYGLTSCFSSGPPLDRNGTTVP
jgi:hypothetical protein